MGTVYLPTTILMEEPWRGRCVHVVGGCDLVDMVGVVGVVGVVPVVHVVSLVLVVRVVNVVDPSVNPLID
jgi:hypothetical protein